MSKVLVVVYSWTGTSRRVAHALASSQQWPLAEIKDAGARSYMGSLVDSLLRRRPPIRYEGPKPGDFDAVVLVSPIWAYRLAGPMRSFVDEWKSSLHDVAVISVMGGSGAPNAVSEVGRLLGRAPRFDAAFTEPEVKDGSFEGRLQAFGKTVQQAEDRAPAGVRPAAMSPRPA